MKLENYLCNICQVTAAELGWALDVDMVGVCDQPTFSDLVDNFCDRCQGKMDRFCEEDCKEDPYAEPYEPCESGAPFNDDLGEL